jgi:hypothetical protein
MSRTILIGDLHGCHDETVALLAKCQVTPTDWVIFLGDYVDRGPDNDKCCDLVRQREQVQGRPAGILGNHEERHLDYEATRLRKGTVEVQAPTHVATRAQLKPEHFAWFRTLPLFIRIPEHNAVAVHAGVYPNRPIEAQLAKHLLHMQMIQPYDKCGNPTHNNKSCWPSRVPDNEDGWQFWTNFWNGPEFIIFGHSVLDRPLITDKVAGIDGGCCFGRDLNAFILDTREVVTVSGAADFGKGRRGRGHGPDIKSYPIHGEIRTFS